MLARSLAAAGTRHLFALSGNHVMPLFDAALDAKLAIVHVRHEAAAAHMADAWGRLTGRPGVALVTGGPGHANALSALYTALAAESPMLLVSGHAPLNELGKGAFQEMRQAELAAPVTKGSWTVQSADRLADEVVRAWRLAVSGRPGPVHLSVPNDVLDAVTHSPLPAAAAFECESAHAPLPAALAEAKRPLVIAGPAAMRSKVDCGIPVIGMESPRGVNDPSLGRLAEVLKKADAVLLAGKRRDFTLKFGAVFSDDCRLIEAEGLPSGMATSDRSWRAEVEAALRYRPGEWHSIEGRNHPVAVCREVQKLLESPQAVLVSDGGEFGQWAQACLAAPHRIINGPAGSIGSALPFAAAAKLALPSSRVVAMLGDGTFGFHMSEIDTAVRHGLDYLAVIGNDATWNAEYQIQLRAYGEARAQGCELLPTRYGAVAAAMGAHGEDVLAFGDLREALRRAAAAGKPSCVNVIIERVAAPKY